MRKPPQNLADLLWQMGRELGATEVGAFKVERDFLGGFELALLSHMRPDNSSLDERAAAIAAFKEIILPCLEQMKDGAIEIDGTSDGKASQYCLVILARRDDAAVGAAAFIGRYRDSADAQRSLNYAQMLSVGLGWPE